MLKHTTKFTSLLLAAGTCFSGTICTFAESTSSADAANATEVFSTPLYTSGLYSTNEQPEGVKVTHNICLDYDNNLMKDNYLIQNESDTDVSFDILIPQIASLASEPTKPPKCPVLEIFLSANVKTTLIAMTGINCFKTIKNGP